jgi:HAD domain in Swiss Army Knife RNA repair proteins
MISPIIFLDIDGVMIAYPEDGSTNPGFTPRCVAAFRLILTAFPSAKVVFSTTWRLPNYVNRLHEQWLEQGFPLSLAMDGTPDLRENPFVQRRQQRGIEIQRWLKANSHVRRWVLLDDDRMAIEEVLDNGRCVFTDPTRGMTASDAEKAMAILTNAPHASPKIWQPSRHVSRDRPRA